MWKVIKDKKLSIEDNPFKKQQKHFNARNIKLKSFESIKVKLCALENSKACLNLAMKFSSSDGRVVRAFASGAEELGLIPSRI